MPTFLVRACAAVAAACALAAPLAAGGPPAPMILVDAHEDVAERLMDHPMDDLAGAPWLGQVDIAKWRAGGVGAAFCAVWVDSRVFRGRAAVRRARDTIAMLRRQADAHSDQVALCQTADDIRRAAAQGRIAIVLAIEDGIALNDDLSLVARYRADGVRYLTLTWRGNLAWAGSSQPWPGETLTGLSDFGRRVVAEMNRVGMVVDLAHASDPTVFDALAATTRPVLVTHSNCRALSDHPRNVTDAMLRAVARNGGVVCVNFFHGYLEPRGLLSDEPGVTTVTVETVADHIAHIAAVAGVAHAGIGSDWEGIRDIPAGLETADGMPLVVAALRRRGFTETEIRMIAGGNVLRVLEANEQPPRDESLW